MDKNPHYSEEIDWNDILGDSEPTAKIPQRPKPAPQKEPVSPRHDVTGPRPRIAGDDHAVKSTVSKSRPSRPSKPSHKDQNPKTFQDYMKSTGHWIIEFPWAHPIIFNIMLMIITGIILFKLLMLFVASWTHHGEEVRVPEVSNVSLSTAINTLERNGFSYEVMDSVFESSVAPGYVVSQFPIAGSTVKSGRTVFLTIMSTSPKTVIVPDFMNMSLRQTKSNFEGLGIKNIQINYVPYEQQDLVLGAKVDGRMLHRGERIPLDAKVILEVGEKIVEEFEEDDTLYSIDNEFSESDVTEETTDIYMLDD